MAMFMPGGGYGGAGSVALPSTFQRPALPAARPMPAGPMPGRPMARPSFAPMLPNRPMRPPMMKPPMMRPPDGIGDGPPPYMRPPMGATPMAPPAGGQPQMISQVPGAMSALGRGLGGGLGMFGQASPFKQVIARG